MSSHGISLPRSSVAALRCALATETASHRTALEKELLALRHERHTRWRSALPRLWHERPAAIFRWLKAENVPFGSRPVLDAAGQQCLSLEAVDEAVRAFWVDDVLRQHASQDPVARWNAFLSSEFGLHLPSASWPTAPWTEDRVRAALRGMREAAAPGMSGVPLATWKAMPPWWFAAIARLLALIEHDRRWPTEWLDAYVAMIPKASGGARPQDQRPITVLEVVYRIWAKGTIMLWTPTLQSCLLGDAAFGFRSQRGTLHAAQVVADLIHSASAAGSELWLASFDLVKCFDSLPWWAVFGTLRHAGVPPATVDCFEAFYNSVRRRFRYGSVDGSPWLASNGLAQGCPASPDLLNILFEAFHRWAASTGCGLTVGGVHIASLSFADDLVLAGHGQAGITVLIDAYLRWCLLLGVRVTKVQLWSSSGAGQSLSVGPSVLRSAPSFRFVGVELGLPEPAASRAHFQARIPKAVAAANRLRSLPLPAAVCCTLWRTAVLPQAVYGCQLRQLLPSDLMPLTSAGKSLFHKPPLELNLWRSPDIAMGLPLGASAVREPIAEARLQQLRWLQLIANSPSLVGTVHRAVACPAFVWREPSPALRSALTAMSWSVRRNSASPHTVAWPVLSPEPSYPGTVTFSAADCFPLPGAAFTDGSFGVRGGAAVWAPDSEQSLLVSVPLPRSSTHCELAALGSAMSLHPSEVFTDSLCALQLLHGWGARSTSATLRCTDRFDVRQVLAASLGCAPPPSLRKVKAHNDGAISAGHPLAVANDVADSLAKQAARATTLPSWAPPDSCHDAVELLDASGDPVLDVEAVFPLAWWRRQRRAWGPPGSRPRLEMLFPVDVPINWVASVAIFARPSLQSDHFHHPVAPPSSSGLPAYAVVAWPPKPVGYAVAMPVTRPAHAVPLLKKMITIFWLAPSPLAWVNGLWPSRSSGCQLPAPASCPSHRPRQRGWTCITYPSRQPSSPSPPSRTTLYPSPTPRASCAAYISPWLSGSPYC